MENHEIEKNLSAGDLSMLSMGNAVKIPKKYYPFMDKYIQDKNPDIRSAAFSFLIFINQPWCLKHLLKGMRDSVITNRSQASLGLEKLSLPDSRQVILDELSFQYMHFSGEDLLPIEALILSVGNIGTKEDIPLLISLLKKNQPAVCNEAYQKAMAKLGYEPAIKEIEQEVAYGEPLVKQKALEKIEYIGKDRWIPKVIPLLADETVTQEFKVGAAHIRRRICEFAINTLRFIDSAHPIPFEDPYISKGPIPYSTEQIQQVRKIYGLDSQEKK